MQFASLYQSCFHALGPRAHKQALKNFFAPACPRFGEHAMIRNFLLQAVIQKPQVIEPFPNNVHQLPLALDVIKEEQEHHFSDRLAFGYYCFKEIAIWATRPKTLILLKNLSR